MLGDAVEWVPGDRFWSTLYAAIQVTIWGAMVSIAVIYVVFFGVTGLLPPVLTWPFGHAGTWQSLTGFVSPWLVFVLSASWSMIGRRPVSGPVGISPLGLSVRRIYRRHTVPWPEIRWRDATRIELREGHAFRRLMLTAQQASRIRRYFGQDALA
jgi:hypothetical protein